MHLTKTILLKYVDKISMIHKHPNRHGAANMEVFLSKKNMRVIS
jgi:hypothetical protein